MEEPNQQKKCEFISFQRNKFKWLTDPNEFTILHVINAAYILKNKHEEFKKILADTQLDTGESQNLFDIFIKNMALSGFSIGGLGKIASMYLRLLERMGARTRHIDPNKSSILPQEKELFDITFSIDHFDSEEMKKIDVKNPKMQALQNYTLLSNQTRMEGFSINSNGDYTTTIYDLFFQLIGFRIREYFRSGNSEKGFTIILQKINNITVKPEDFNYILLELKKRNPIRYS